METKELTNNRFRIFLEQELLNRTVSNPSYSMRAFARQLNMDSSVLSQILNKKRKLTDTMCRKIASNLKLESDETLYLLSFDDTQKVPKRFRNFRFIEDDHFLLISHWYHYGILQLTHLKEFQPDKKWVAKQLRISIQEVNSAVRRLEELGLLEVHPDKWIDLGGTTKDGGVRGTAPSYRKLQNQILHQAQDALEKVSYEKRLQNSFTIAANSEQISKIRNEVSDFMSRINAMIEEGDKDGVYQFSVSLFPINLDLKMKKGEKK